MDNNQEFKYVHLSNSDKNNNDELNNVMSIGSVVPNKNINSFNDMVNNERNPKTALKDKIIPVGDSVIPTDDGANNDMLNSNMISMKVESAIPTSANLDSNVSPLMEMNTAVTPQKKQEEPKKSFFGNKENASSSKEDYRHEKNDGPETNPLLGITDNKEEIDEDVKNIFVKNTNKFFNTGKQDNIDKGEMNDTRLFKKNSGDNDNPALSSLNVAPEYNNLKQDRAYNEPPYYVNDDKIKENIKGYEKKTIQIGEEMKVFLIIAAIMLVFIIFMPGFFDIVSKLKKG